MLTINDIFIKYSNSQTYGWLQNYISYIEIYNKTNTEIYYYCTKCEKEYSSDKIQSFINFVETYTINDIIKTFELDKPIQSHLLRTAYEELLKKEMHIFPEIEKELESLSSHQEVSQTDTDSPNWMKSLIQEEFNVFHFQESHDKILQKCEEAIKLCQQDLKILSKELRMVKKILKSRARTV